MEANDLIYLVSCAANGATPEPERFAGTDLDALYAQAEKHMLTAAVAPALEAAGVTDARFVRALQHSALKNAQMDMETEAVFAEMDAAGIWYLPLKGTVLQHLYPVYGMRQMSDHDILFDADRAEELRGIMEGLGFTTELFDYDHHDVYNKEPVSSFEMHRVLFSPSPDRKLYDYYRDVGKRLLGDGCGKHLSPEDFYLYLTAHTYKHFILGGTGLRSLLDAYVYLRAESPDLAYVAAEAEKLGIADFEKATRELALHLFGGEALLQADRELLAYFLASGAYGNWDNKIQNRLTRLGCGKLRYAFERFIEPVNKKSWNYPNIVKEFPFFYRHKLLLPLLMFHRLFRSLFSGRFTAEFRALKHARR